MSSKVMGVPQVNHHAKSLECAECLEGKSENPLFRCLNAPCWMKIGCTFLIPPGHLLTTSTTRSRRPHRVLSSSPNPPGPGNLCRLQGLTQLWLDQNSIGDAGARRPGVADVVLEQKSSARRGQSEGSSKRRCSSNCHWS